MTAVGLALGLAGCAPVTAASEPAATYGERWVLVTTTAWTDTEDLAVRATAVAGVPVQVLRSVAPDTHAVRLMCEDAAACRQAVARLRGDGAWVRLLEPDGRERVPAPPPRSSSR